jgi:hypothetical protein
MVNRQFLLVSIHSPLFKLDSYPSGSQEINTGLFSDIPVFISFYLFTFFELGSLMYFLDFKSPRGRDCVLVVFMENTQHIVGVL